MIRIAGVGFVLLVLLGISNSAQGYFGELNFIPSNPVAGQMVEVQIEVGICDVIWTLPGDQEITLNNNTIRITVEGAGPIISPCVAPVIFHQYELGAFPAGSYTVEFYRRLIGDPSAVDLIRTGQFIVAALPPSPPDVIPGLGGWGLFGLLLGVSTIGLLRLRPS